MSLRAIAVGIVAVVCMSGSALAEGITAAASAGSSIAAFPGVGLARPIPFLPALRSRAGAFHLEDAATDSVRRESRHSTVLREVVLAGASIGAGFLLDDTFQPGSGEGTAMDNVGQFIGSPYTLGAGTLLLGAGGAIAHHPNTVTTAKKLLLAMAATTVTVAGLKAATNRERPDGSDHNSFPSGHSGASFAAATVLDRHYHGAAVRWTAYGIAAFVAASRVVGNRHFFSDVVAGAAIGRFYGRMFTLDH